MEKKINIVELLKDCPRGMELNCTAYDNVSFDKISDDKKAPYPIFCYITDEEGNHSSISFTEDGCESKRYGAKCVIFPKGKNTWEGFQRPFKDGDIISNGFFDTICIFKGEGIIKGTVDFYCGIGTSDELFIKDIKDQNGHFGEINEYNFATEEEKQKLFNAIKENGYKWNSDTKTLEKLFHYNIGTKVWVKSDKEHKYIHIIVGISHNSFGNLEYEIKEEKTGVVVHYPESLLIPITTEKPKFKVGDKIRHKILNFIHVITGIKDEYYIMDEVSFPHGILPIEAQNEYELVPDKFDVTILKPFDKVLVRDGNYGRWKIQFFAKFDKELKYPFICMDGRYSLCIPYSGNEYLHDTTNPCSDYYQI